MRHWRCNLFSSNLQYFPYILHDCQGVSGRPQPLQEKRDLQTWNRHHLAVPFQYKPVIPRWVASILHYLTHFALPNRWTIMSMHPKPADLVRLCNPKPADLFYQYPLSSWLHPFRAATGDRSSYLRCKVCLGKEITLLLRIENWAEFHNKRRIK